MPCFPPSWLSFSSTLAGDNVVNAAEEAAGVLIGGGSNADTGQVVTVLFDDYVSRPAYHVVEQMIRPIALHGRMAQFQIDPTPMPASPERWITASFQRPL